MYTKQYLKENLKSLGITSKDTLLVHVSLKSIGKTENGADTVLDALCEYMKDGLLVLPAHTWSTIDAQHPLFSVNETPTCVGVLTELFRKREGVYRSLHPTHSLSAYGKAAQSFTRGQEKFHTPCAPESCYGELERRNGKVLFIGVDFSRNTLVHCIEEVAQVEGRIGSVPEPLVVKDENGNMISIPSYRHENANSDRYVKLEPVMEYRGLLKRGKFGDADCLLCNIKDLFEITLDLLSKNPRLFDDFEPVPLEWYHMQK